MFLGRNFMEHYSIDHMLLDDKLKKPSAKKSGVSVEIKIEGF